MIFINEAYQVKNTIEATLVRSLEHKAILEELDSQSEFPNDFADINDALVQLFKLIENNEVEEARNEQNKLLTQMAALEVKVLIKRHVAYAEFILDKAEDNDADDYAEITFEQAEKAIVRATKFIENNYRQRQQVEQVGNEALVAAQRALNIGELSQSLVKLSEEDAEQKALMMEALIAKIAQAIGKVDIKGLPLDEQTTALVALAAKYKEAFETLNAQHQTSEVKDIQPSDAAEINQAY